MTELATPLHLVPWMSITSLEIQMQSLLDYVFELVSFMPQLKKLRISKLVLPETVVRNYDPDVPYNSEDDVDPDEDDMTQFQQKCSGHDERLDMTQYAAQLSKQYAPLRQSELTQLKLVYDGAVSAQCIILTHHLCKRFIPKLEDLRIKSTMHNLINGKWRCSYNWVCHYHGDKV
ncbi:hypothetical protein IWW51_003561 [Coemansia sp. RSA 2702]|nr:hypothetical protein IWW54_003173 [Coemansia sp. RSA 2705]KAJ2319489.1 hypothetical protein IWW52_001941 [Coemansia sp. RSA 2704]KAJ2323846.1 hypothetical protein IWW51_003561 [Coemansia sp. RSA 2702]